MYVYVAKNRPINWFIGEKHTKKGMEIRCAWAFVVQVHLMDDHREVRQRQIRQDINLYNKKAALISISSSAAFYTILSTGLYLVLSEILIPF